MQEGRIAACKQVRQACQRHLDDLKRSANSRWPFRFDERKANLACAFIEQLPHTKGAWAAGKENRIRLEPWQCWVLCCIFGWVRKDTGLRRFRTAYVCVPRKNGKSIIAGGIGLKMFAADGEHGAEVYSGATSEKQAWEVFRPAKQMLEATPRLRQLFGIQIGAKNLAVPRTRARFEPVVHKPGDGASPSCAIVDEYHEHSTDELVDTMRTGMGARLQPLLLIITTAGTNIAGPCKAQQDELEKVLDGTLERDDLFGVVYTIDADTDWTQPAALQMANPNYGVSVYEEYLLQEQRNAINNASKQAIFRTKHLNQWVNAASGWMNMVAWNAAADPTLQPEDFADCPAYLGVDLSNKLDATAAVLVFCKVINGVDHYYLFPRLWLPEERAKSPEHQHFQKWVLTGELHTTPGNMIEHEAIADDVVDLCNRFRVQELAYDQTFAQYLAQRVQQETATVAVEVPQRKQYLSEPMQNVEALVLSGRVHHPGNECFSWMMSNVVAKPDALGKVFPLKASKANLIDGAVATIMAMSRAATLEDTTSVYETRGILFT